MRTGAGGSDAGTRLNRLIAVTLLTCAKLFKPSSNPTLFLVELEVILWRVDTSSEYPRRSSSSTSDLCQSFNPTGDNLYAYKMGLDGSGKPLFTLAGKAAAVFAGKGVPTVTTNGGQAGTGIVSTFSRLGKDDGCLLITIGMGS